MPAKSEKQRRYFSWAYNHPDQAAAEGKLPKSMSKAQMHDFMTAVPNAPERSPGTKKRKFYGEK